MSQLQYSIHSSASDRASNAAADANEKVTALFPPSNEEAAVDSALDLFNRMSRQITDSYRTLESRVNQLSGELSAESRQRQQELEEKERLADRLSTLLSVMPAGVVVLDSRGVVSQCNPAAVSLLGEPLEGEAWLEVIRRCFAPRRDDGHEVSLRDGRRVSIEIRSMENEPGQLILLTDLTETRRLQAQLSHAQRLSAMGKMVASLAHQIRTPLSAAILYGGHLSQPDLDEELRQRCANRLMSRLTHLEQQVRDMLIFARGETRLAEQLPLKSLTEGLKSAAEGLSLKSGIELEWDVQAEDGAIHCNRDALVGACMNLVSNSLEAGATRVTLGLHEVDGQLEIAVGDNGPGFEPSHKEQLLEAFYTTKSQGTGLGLAVVQAVVKAHRGEFTLESNGADGALARLRLPLVAAQPS
ncbi:sensor histidine kinase FleS [Marinobacter nanhaiticus D15-8W]|uniref:histidine kinase n=1 Tax=Marinobacter nanhaiticus D15-8W TaxID=626887 RepID=N6X7A2_9GAMM|nr:ATP-binding protein [Marinobacter nanhaiticus]ENO17023.1 PAS domain-containing sensor histidine kinase [Marinobacter nanhaiticus D15-8W]BES71981.1 sensor histidine kinase FleS [Marinobacter nanhaiticus D15-8W]